MICQTPGDIKFLLSDKISGRGAGKMNLFFNRDLEDDEDPCSNYAISNWDSEEVEILSLKIKEIIQSALDESRDIVFLCIGSDHSIGDALGPLTGTMLVESQIPYRVYGTLEEPVHALNITDSLKMIDENSLIFSIDAFIGDEEQVGYLLFKEGPVSPGKALERDLPEVGDFHFLGVVNYSDQLPPAQFLSDTRLFTVMSIAKTIVKVIRQAV